MKPPTTQTIIDPRHTNLFRVYRTNILHQDHPQLAPSQANAGAQAIANNIADLATKTRLTREKAEARRVQDSNKTARDLYGPSLSRMLRFAQVGSESALQPIHDKLAKDKKYRQHHTLQAAVDAALASLGYRLNFPVTASLTRKVIDLEYYSSLENEFSTGLNIFCTSQLEPESIKSQRLQIAQTDTVMQNAASALLSDFTTILDPSGDVCIPTLCAAGAMALLCGHVDTNIIQLLGRWGSDEMLRYLYLQAAPVM